MVGNGEVMTKVRLSVEGIEATKKNLEALKNGAEATREKIEGLHKEMKQAMDAGDLKEADKIMKKFFPRFIIYKDLIAL